MRNGGGGVGSFVVIEEETRDDGGLQEIDLKNRVLSLI